jgi:hypothetical protein
VALAVLLPGAALAQGYGYSQRVSLPQGTVLKAELNDRLSSTSSRPGDRFTGNVVNDGTGLPSGTQVIGQVTDVRRADDNHPGVVDVDFRTLRLPNGRTYPIDGRLTSLDSDSVQRTSSGRLEARGRSSRNKYQFLGYGAGGGALISALTGGNLLKGALLGAIAGFAYDQLNKDKRDNGHYSEVNLKPGTEFGVALQSGTTVSLADNPYGNSNGGRFRNGSSYDSRNSRTDERTAGSFQQYRGSPIRVLVDGREVPFTQGQPFMAHGHVMVPLEPVMAAAGYRYTYDPTYREVSISGNRDTRFTIGDNFATVDGNRMRLDEAVQRIDGTIFVPSQLLEQAADFRTDWNADNRTLRLRSGARNSNFSP